MRSGGTDIKNAATLYVLKSSESKERIINPRGEFLDKWCPHLAARTLLTRGSEYLFIISFII